MKMEDKLTVFMLDKYRYEYGGTFFRALGNNSESYKMLTKCLKSDCLSKGGIQISSMAFLNPDENEIWHVNKALENASILIPAFANENWYLNIMTGTGFGLEESINRHLEQSPSEHVVIWYCLPKLYRLSNDPRGMHIKGEELNSLRRISKLPRTSLVFIQPDGVAYNDKWRKYVAGKFPDATNTIVCSVYSQDAQYSFGKIDWPSYKEVIETSLYGKHDTSLYGKYDAAEEYYEEETEPEEEIEEEIEDVKEVDPSIKNMIGTLTSYVNTLHPLIYINHFDFRAIDEAIQEVASDATAKCIEFNNALGLLDFETKSPMLDACSLEDFLRGNMDEGFEQKTFLILKDVHEALNDQVIIALLKRIAEDTIYNESYSETIFILSEMTVIPPELESFITIIDFPLPNETDIRTMIDKFISEKSGGENIPEDGTEGDSVGEEAAGDDAAGEDTVSEEAIRKELTLSFKGLNEFQIKQILNLAYHEYNAIDKNAKGLVLREKTQYLKKSGLLEIISTTESADNIGGLENLKDWLKSRAEIFKNLGKAVNFGVDIPKGILIAGMPGCGKSLTAKATAGMFEMPLVRLDVGRLLGKYVGESEENMRKALKLAEAISPCVLWIDEIEKAFAGVGGEGGGNDVTTRLFGQFLTWMQEKESTVFIVATANDISNLPPEFLRKGRFDEVFFVDLPNEEERQQILEIHLKNRKKWKDGIIELEKIASKTNGFSGADLESVVKETILTAFIQNKRHTITTGMLLKTVEDTSPISKTLGEKIERLRKTVEKYSLKPASR